MVAYVGIAPLAGELAHSYDLENLLSPSLAAAALVVMSYDALFVENAFAFLASALLVYSVMLPKARPSYRTGGVWRYLSVSLLPGLW